jgi:hypothetical protein
LNAKVHINSNSEYHNVIQLKTAVLVSLNSKRMM